MAIEIHGQGRVVAGSLPRFATAVERYKEYAASHGYAVPQVLTGLSWDMNTVRLVNRYANPADYPEQKAKTLHDEEYGRIAGGMSFVDGTIRYQVYQQV